MPFWLTRFGSLEIPLCNAVQDVGLAAISGATQLVNGRIYDSYGSGPSPIRLPYNINAQATLHAKAPVDLEQQYYALRAAVGTRNLLYRRRTGVAYEESAYARLLEVSASRDVRDGRRLDVTLGFEILSMAWNGEDSSTLVTLDVAPKSISLTNSGNAIQRDIIATLTAAGSNITAFRLENLTAGHVSSINYANTIAVGKQLVINCGLQTIVNNGVSDYAHLTFNTWHTIADWFRLAPGTNSIRITRTGGSVASTVAFSYHDAWA